MQQNSFKTKAVIKEIESKIDIPSYTDLESDGTINLNDICKVRLKTADTVSFDSYRKNRKTGAFILVNENTNSTVAAGVIA